MIRREWYGFRRSANPHQMACGVIPCERWLTDHEVSPALHWPPTPFGNRNLVQRSPILILML